MVTKEDDGRCELWTRVLKFNAPNFDFDEFTSEVIKQVTRKASSKGFNTVLQEGTASISRSGNQPNVTALCKEPEDWEGAHEVAKQWQDEKRKGICVQDHTKI